MIDHENSPQPVVRSDDDELMGYILPRGEGWAAHTIFGYEFAQAPSRAAAERLVLEKGLAALMGVWHYFDADDQAWQPCVIQEAAPTRVRVARVSEYGQPDPDDPKTVILAGPEILTRLRRDML